MVTKYKRVVYENTKRVIPLTLRSDIVFHTRRVADAPAGQRLARNSEGLHVSASPERKGLSASPERKGLKYKTKLVHNWGGETWGFPPHLTFWQSKFFLRECIFCSNFQDRFGRIRYAQKWTLFVKIENLGAPLPPISTHGSPKPEVISGQNQIKSALWDRLFGFAKTIGGSNQSHFWAVYA